MNVAALKVSQITNIACSHHLEPSTPDAGLHSHRDVKTRVRSRVGTTEGFEVKVGLHQGSALSPFLFNIVFDVLTRGVRRGVPWSMMYADDVVLWGETSGEVERRLEEWRVALESGGMRISRTKTEYMRCTHHDQDREQRVEVRLDGEVIKSVDGLSTLGQQ